MSLCAVCGMRAVVGLCPQHHVGADDWARANRVMCDLLHRAAAEETDEQLSPR